MERWQLEREGFIFSSSILQLLNLIISVYIQSLPVSRKRSTIPSSQPERSSSSGTSRSTTRPSCLLRSSNIRLSSSLVKLTHPVQPLTSLLRDVSTSITTYLHDTTSPYRSLAVDLCSTGFQIWQHYIDAMEILRSLFRLATQKPSFGQLTTLASQARNSTLHIASTNTPLFMATLAFDILNATSPAQRNATMKLVAFMAKRRPLVLYSSLARIAEAVVKSLDPNVTAQRDAVQQTATVILDSLVNT